MLIHWPDFNTSLDEPMKALEKLKQDGKIRYGVVAAVKEVGLQVPLVVRLEGTNVEKGKDIINNSGLDVIAANDLRDGAKKIVRAVKG